MPHPRRHTHTLMPRKKAGIKKNAFLARSNLFLFFLFGCQFYYYKISSERVHNNQGIREKKMKKSLNSNNFTLTLSYIFPWLFFSVRVYLACTHIQTLYQCISSNIDVASLIFFFYLSKVVAKRIKMF